MRAVVGGGEDVKDLFIHDGGLFLFYLYVCVFVTETRRALGFSRSD